MIGSGILLSLVALAFIFLEIALLKKKHIRFWISLLGSQILVTILEFADLNSISQIIILVAAFLLRMLAGTVQV